MKIEKNIVRQSDHNLSRNVNELAKYLIKQAVQSINYNDKVKTILKSESDMKKKLCIVRYNIYLNQLQKIVFTCK